MRFRHPDGSVVHLAYCTNVHPAEDVDGIVEQLERFAGAVRAALGAPVLGVGLWLPAEAAAGLAGDERALGRLRSALAAQGLEVVTLNGFPYRGFHAPVVKRDVYVPDWAEDARLAYTLDLARVLGGLLPEDAAEGTISTLPLAWRTRWGDAPAGASRANLERLATALAGLAGETGVPVRVGLEPEPGCVVETTGQAATALSGIDPEWVGVCVDACHLAVQFEPAEAVAALAAPVVKAQVSNALRVERPRSEAAAATLAAYAEPRFLHQTRERRNGSVVGVDDLDEAIAGGLPGDEEWRIHFHVPVHVGGEQTTQPELERTLAALVGGPAPLTRHLEVETYTWTVLPQDRRPADDAGLVRALAQELAWTRERLLELGLEEVTA
jgi:sugar phosphate isomerase/epimerase